MRTNVGMVFVLLLLMIWLTGGLGQNAGMKGKDKGPRNEDEVIFKGIEKAFKGGPTEREKLLKDLQKVTPGFWDAAGTGGGREFDQWFAALSGGQGVWRYDEIGHKPLRDMFERMADRLGVTSGVLTRQQFLIYARQYLGEGTSPSWNAGGPSSGEMEKLFRQLDANGDSLLNYDEMPDALRAERPRWDANGDGFIDSNEYRVYFQARMRRALADSMDGVLPSKGGPDGPARVEEEERRPVVYRFGRLPAGIPAWFSQLDTDQDGQLGLYEWRKSGRPLSEFQKMDRTGDGFLTAEELLHYLGPAEPESGATRAGVTVTSLEWGGRGDKKEKGPKGGPKGEKKPKGDRKGRDRER